MNTPPEVTIVIPTHNRWPLLSSAALPSALEQEGVDLEVVVVDDGSTDGTADRLEQLREPRLRVVRHERARRVAAARNSGIGAALGTWLAFLDDDDLWAPDKLRRQLDVAHAEQASLVYSAVVALDGGWRTLHATWPDVPDRLHERLLVSNVIPAGSSNVLVRADVIRAAGGFDERLTYTEDWDLWLRISDGIRPAVVPEIHVGYVRHPFAMAFGGRRAVDEITLFVDKHRAAGLAVDPSRFVGWIASEHRAARRRREAAATYLHSALAFGRPRHLVSAATSLVDRKGRGLLHPRRGEQVSHRVEEPVLDPPWLEQRRTRIAA